MAEDVQAGESAGQRVEFYITDESAPNARLRLACRLAEKAYLAGQRVLVWHSDADELRKLDDLLWTFADRSFVPHELLGPMTADSEAPVLLASSAPFAGAAPNAASGAPIACPFDVLINLAPDIPACADQAPRIAEIIDGDDGCRKAGRVRFKTYRDRGVQPITHNIRAE